MPAEKDRRSFPRDSSLRALCQRASIVFGFKCAAESPLISPHVCLYLTDFGDNRVIFNFANNAPGTYTIEAIHYHDAGMLGVAVELSHIAAPDTKVRNHDIRPSIRLDQSVPGDPVSRSDYDNCVQDHSDPLFYTYDDCQSESVVNMFDLRNDKGFPDVVSAMAEARLFIMLQLLDLESRCHRLYVNDPLPMIG